MNEEIIKTVHMCESFVTYINKGSIKMDLDKFPNLVGKTNKEINDWITSNGDTLFVNWEGEIRLNSCHYYEEGELEEGEEPEVDPDSIPLWEYFNNAGVEFDKIKDEERYFETE